MHRLRLRRTRSEGRFSHGSADLPAGDRAPLGGAQPLDPAIPTEMEHRLTTDHQELRRAVFDQMIVGAQGGLDYLRELVAEVHRDLWSVCEQGLGEVPAKGVFQAALRDAMTLYPDLAYRCGLTRPLES